MDGLDMQKDMEWEYLITPESDKKKLRISNVKRSFRLDLEADGKQEELEGMHGSIPSSALLGQLPHEVMHDKRSERKQGSSGLFSRKLGKKFGKLFQRRHKLNGKGLVVDDPIDTTDELEISAESLEALIHHRRKTTNNKHVEGPKQSTEIKSDAQTIDLSTKNNHGAAASGKQRETVNSRKSNVVNQPINNKTGETIPGKRSSFESTVVLTANKTIEQRQIPATKVVQARRGKDGMPKRNTVAGTTQTTSLKGAVSAKAKKKRHTVFVEASPGKRNSVEETFLPTANEPATKFVQAHMGKDGMPKRHTVTCGMQATSLKGAASEEATKKRHTISTLTPSKQHQTISGGTKTTIKKKVSPTATLTATATAVSTATAKSSASATATAKPKRTTSATAKPKVIAAATVNPKARAKSTSTPTQTPSPPTTLIAKATTKPNATASTKPKAATSGRPKAKTSPKSKIVTSTNPKAKAPASPNAVRASTKPKTKTSPKPKVTAPAKPKSTPSIKPNAKGKSKVSATVKTRSKVPETAKSKALATAKPKATAIPNTVQQTLIPKLREDISNGIGTTIEKGVITATMKPKNRPIRTAKKSPTARNSHSLTRQQNQHPGTRIDIKGRVRDNTEKETKEGNVKKQELFLSASNNNVIISNIDETVRPRTIRKKSTKYNLFLTESSYDVTISEQFSDSDEEDYLYEYGLPRRPNVSRVSTKC